MNNFMGFLQNGRALFYDGDDGSGSGGGDDGAGDSGDGQGQDTFNFKDPQTHTDHKLPKKVGDVDLQVMIGHIIGKSNREAEKKAETKYKGLVEKIQSESSSQFSELQAKVEELEMEKLTEQEKAEKLAEKKVSEAQKKSDEHKFYAETNWQLFKENKIDNDIISALGKHDLYNPAQTRMVLKQMGEADIVQDNGSYRTTLKLNIDGEVKEMTPKEAGEYFLAQPENAHHLKNNLRSGGGTNQGGNSGRMGTDGTIHYTRTSLKDEKVRAEYNKKLRDREPVQIVDG